MPIAFYNEIAELRDEHIGEPIHTHEHIGRGGRFAVAVLGVPCSTFSAARIGGDGANDPAPVRGRAHEARAGLPGLDAMQQRELDRDR